MYCYGARNTNYFVSTPAYNPDHILAIKQRIKKVQDTWFNKIKR